MSSADPLDRVRAAIAATESAGLRRLLRPRPAVEDVLDLAGNDYLGLSRDQRVVQAGVDAAQAWGSGSTGSRLVTGSTELHRSLEGELAAFIGAPSALVFSSGYLANLGAICALGGPEVTVVSDAGNHASIIDACRLSGSPVVVAPHRDVDKVGAALASIETPHALVVTDAVFSVDGDVAPLRELHRIVGLHSAILLVDEAHSLGVVGAGGVGAVASAGLAEARDVVRTLTLSKSLGAQGGVVAGAPEVIELLVNSARAFIFDTGLAPACAGAAREALRVLIAEPGRSDAVRDRARALAGIVRELGAETVVPDAAIVPAFLGDPRSAVAAAAACLAAGIRVGCFRPPSVPLGRSCLRMTARADLTAGDLARASDVLAAVLG
ncbi:MAG: 8-amino-7-oxononanoate synthase [Actinomycetota bacterium]|nr:8-amino-7-oxononanoate synthase [Actinomycetota bacterium]